MLKFEDFMDLNESMSLLNEVQIQFNKNRDVKFGNVLILAGGAGSGKGFVLDKLIGMSGKVFDVDALKTLAQKSPKIVDSIKKEFDTDISSLNLKTPEDVFKLHTIIGDELNLPDKQQQTFYTSILTAHPDRKPNIVFDVTLKDMRKLEKITKSVTDLGYDKKKIHLVWIVNDIEIAKQQNQERSRTVPEFILVNTHSGASTTMKEIVGMGEDLRNLIDGDIFFTFNKANIDNEWQSGDKKSGGVLNRSKIQGGYFTKAAYVQLKQVGKAPLKLNDVSEEIVKKINSYVPDDAKW